MRTVAYTITRTVCGSSNRTRIRASTTHSIYMSILAACCVIYNCMNTHMFMHTSLGKYARKGKALYIHPYIFPCTLLEGVQGGVGGSEVMCIAPQQFLAKIIKVGILLPDHSLESTRGFLYTQQSCENINRSRSFATVNKSSFTQKEE